MNERPSFDAIYLELADLMSQRSTCARLHVGCAIVSADMRQVLAVGYNGNVAGGPNACDSDVVGACGCLHAEDNACLSCAAPRALPKIVYLTDSPCVTCAKRLINLGGVVRVSWSRTYRVQDGIELLRAYGIEAASDPRSTRSAELEKLRGELASADLALRSYSDDVPAYESGTSLSLNDRIHGLVGGRGSLITKLRDGLDELLEDRPESRLRFANLFPSEVTGDPITRKP